MRRLYQNHVLANLIYLLVLAFGILAYAGLPREKTPDVSQNQVEIPVFLPGASPEDVERRVIVPIERVLRSRIRDIRRVSSEAQTGQAHVSVRFNDIDRPTYDKRVAELRRELQALTQTELPKEAEMPPLYEGMSFDWYKIILYGPGEDENFRRQARQVRRDLERLPGVGRVDMYGVEAPELHVVFRPERLLGLGLSPQALADTVGAYFHDIAAGTVKVGGRDWLVRLLGTEDAAAGLAALPVTAARGVVKLGDLADISRSSKAVKVGERFLGQPAVVLVLFKQPGTNTLQLLDSVKSYVDTRNRASDTSGVRLFLLNDTSETVRQAIAVMQEHALSGIALVFAVSWAMLGGRLALLTTTAVPFSLAGVFITLQATGQTLNLSVLLGVVIVLGMLVDDAVVVIEAIGQRLRHGLAPLAATVDALREVWLPVATSSFTTMAAFLPLMLIHGYLGEMMGIVPFVACLALAVSLVQALWILPAHGISALAGGAAQWRERWAHRLNLKYGRGLVWVMRRPKRSLSVLLAVLAIAGGAVGLGWVDFNFLPEEPQHGFGVTIEMPNGTRSEQTLATLLEIEKRVTAVLRPGELRASLAQSGFIEKAGKALYGHQYGDVWFDLAPAASRDAAELMPLAKLALRGLAGPVELRLSSEEHGPVGKPISLKVSGNDEAELAGALQALRGILEGLPGIGDIALENLDGLPELKLRLNGEAIQRAGVAPETVARTLRLLADGEVVASVVEQDETVGVRVRARDDGVIDIAALLRHTVVSADGGSVPLRELLLPQQRVGPALIKRYDFRRVQTLEADLDKAKTDTLLANRLIQARWQQIRDRYPNVSVDFTGEVEAVEEGLGQLRRQFLLGVGLIFVIVGAQFQSYRVPLLVLAKIPMAFAGVALGLLVSREPLSLYTLYGGVALAGITVNSAILLFSAVADRTDFGMSVPHATVYAARRRLMPILITSTTTLVGLLPLALGNDEASSMWRPVATAIVWGLGFSTLLTLFVVPLLYWVAMDTAKPRSRL